MKNSGIIEPPILNIERDPLFLMLFIGASALLAFCDYLLFRAVNPWGFAVMVPSAVMVFQSIWLLLHPFALVFKDRIEIRRTIFSNKLWYFIDIKKITKTANGNLFITYNDGEIEQIKLFGIRKSHVALLSNEIEKNITLQPVS